MGEKPISSCFRKHKHSFCLAFCASSIKLKELLQDIRFSAPVVLILVVLSVQFFDFPLAAWIAKLQMTYARHLNNSNIPDLLLIITISLTSLSWLGYFYFVHRNIHDQRAQFLRLVGIIMPVSYVVKDLLKWFFGRTNTRIWLQYPGLHGFHWFAGTKGFEGFPSGHMLLFTPLLLALWKFFPRYRLHYGIAWLSLAVALIVTEYHFLGDIIAGAYIGVVVYLVVSHVFR